MNETLDVIDNVGKIITHDSMCEMFPEEYIGSECYEQNLSNIDYGKVCKYAVEKLIPITKPMEYLYEIINVLVENYAEQEKLVRWDLPIKYVFDGSEYTLSVEEVAHVKSLVDLNYKFKNLAAMPSEPLSAVDEKKKFDKICEKLTTEMDKTSAVFTKIGSYKDESYTIGKVHSKPAVQKEAPVYCFNGTVAGNISPHGFTIIIPIITVSGSSGGCCIL